MSDVKRTALEAEAALAKVLLSTTLYDSDKRAIEQALIVVRSLAVKGYA